MDAFLEGVFSRLQEFFNPASLGAQVAEFVTDVVVFAVIFAAFYLLWLMVRRPLQRLLTQTKLDETAVTFAETVAKYTILLIGIVNAMAAAGINTASVLASLGIAGLTIGFAARDAFSNLISGLLIFLEQNDILDAESRELVIDRALALDATIVGEEELKWIVLLVLINQPGREIAFAQMEDMVYNSQPVYIH